MYHSYTFDLKKYSNVSTPVPNNINIPVVAQPCVPRCRLSAGHVPATRRRRRQSTRRTVARARTHVRRSRPRARSLFPGDHATRGGCDRRVQQARGHRRKIRRLGCGAGGGGNCREQIFIQRVATPSLRRRPERTRVPLNKHACRVGVFGAPADSRRYIKRAAGGLADGQVFARAAAF